MENVFRNKNFCLVFFGRLVSNVGALLYSFAMSFYILEVTGNDSIIQGVYLAVCGVSYCVFSLIGGVISDRFHKGKIMYLCDLIKGFIIALSALIIYLVRDNNALQLVTLFAVGIIGQGIGAIFSPASSSLFPCILKEEQLRQANSYNSVLGSFQSIAGALLGGVLYALLPFYWLVIIVGLCYIGSGISEMFITYEYKKSEEPLTLKSAFADIKDGGVYLFKQKTIMTLMLGIVFLNFFLAPIFDNFIPYFIETEVGTYPDYLFHEIFAPEMWSSVLTVGSAIGGIAGGMMLSRGGRDKNVMKAIKFWLGIFSLLMVVFTVSYYVLVQVYDLMNVYLVTLALLDMFNGFVLSHINIRISTTLMEITEPSKLGKVSAFIDLSSQGLIPLATFGAGIIIAYGGVLTLLWACTAGVVLTTAFILMNKSISDFKKNQDNV